MAGRSIAGPDRGWTAHGRPETGIEIRGYNSEGILRHGVGNKPVNSEVDVSLIYGDYYFFEALSRLLARPARPPLASLLKLHLVIAAPFVAVRNNDRCEPLVARLRGTDYRPQVTSIAFVTLKVVPHGEELLSEYQS